jgi:hypothetical protein
VYIFSGAGTHCHDEQRTVRRLREIGRQVNRPIRAGGTIRGDQDAGHLLPLPIVPLPIDDRQTIDPVLQHWSRRLKDRSIG